MKKDNNIKLLQKFNIKPCQVNLTKMEFSKIRIGCSVKSSEPNVKLVCDLKQKNANTFTLKITRKTCADNGSGPGLIGVSDSINSQPKSIGGDPHNSPMGIYFNYYDDAMNCWYCRQLILLLIHFRLFGYSFQTTIPKMHKKRSFKSTT